MSENLPLLSVLPSTVEYGACKLTLVILRSLLHDVLLYLVLHIYQQSRLVKEL